MESLLYFLLWAVAIFFMMRFGCGAHVMGHGHGHADSHPDGSMSPDGMNRGGSPEKALDPVCDMTVETAKAKSAVHDGHVYYFCSQDCREKFEANPTSYLKAASNAPAVKEHHHAG